MEQNKDKEPNIYKVPEDTKIRVRDFMNNFLREHELTKTAVAKLMEEKLGRSGSKTAFIDKFARASFKLSEVMEILDLYGYELKIVSKGAIEPSEKQQ